MSKKKLGIVFGVSLVVVGVAREAGAAVLFADDFSTTTGVWTGYDGTVAIVGGAYSLSAGQDVRAAAFVGQSSWKDYFFDADVNLTAGAQLGVLFHVKDIAGGLDQGHYYQFDVNGSSAEFYRLNQPGGSTQRVAIATVSPLGTNVWHHLRLDIEGTTATAYLDGSSVLQYGGFSDYTFGGIGLKSYNSAARFDNVLVTTIPEPGLAGVAGAGALALAASMRRRVSERR